MRNKSIRRKAWTQPVSLALLGLAAAPAFASTSDTSCNPITANSTQGSPYDSTSAYRDLINNVQKLQFPSASECISQTELKARNILADRFYRSGSKLVFDIRNAARLNRMELRGNEWTSSSTTARNWDGTFNLPDRAAVDELTLGQVLSVSPSLPVVRIAYIRSRSSGGTTYTNKMWAIFHPSPDESVPTTYHLLGDAPTSTTAGRTRMTYGPNHDIVIRYTINGATTTRTLPLNTWSSSSRQVYYKAGCYLQSAGDCRVTFSSLMFDD
jgi:hypothetical protein